jgi:hypothetical protein
VNADGSHGTRTIVAPKGIYKTPHGYRVQLNIEHKSKKPKKRSSSRSVAENAKTETAQFNHLDALRSTISASMTTEIENSATNTGKFSRNSKNFEDAVWLYEVAILLSDNISSVSELVGRGNYESMQAMRVSF